MSRAINATKQIKIRDLLAFVIFALVLVPSIIYRFINKMRGRNIWLISEEGHARDNGYHFFKYIRLNHPSDPCYYAIKTDSVDYSKVSGLGMTVKWGSIRHWFLYMSASLNISSQKSGNPCPIFWYIIHVLLGLYNNRVFLQHGITKDDSKWLYYNKTKFKYFVCGAKREYEYILEKYGYAEKALLLTGFPRWDNLKAKRNSEKKHRTILIMPTWRNWLGRDENGLFKSENFEDTHFYRCWQGLLDDLNFIRFIEDNHIIVYFYPHSNMMKYLNSFKTKSNNIKIVSTSSDIQYYFNNCDLMITDYSSVAFDFAYLKKPVLYYQFDYQEYRNRQYQEGYYSYEKNGFGPVAYDLDCLFKNIQEIHRKNYECDMSRINDFFGNTINACSQRLYNVLKNHNFNTAVTVKQDKMVSVVTPVYNCEKYVGRCLDQFIKQDYPNFELIIIDDGSTDKTKEIIESYCRSDDRIKLLCQKHAGPSLAREKGIKEAGGDIVMFVDADDYLVENALSVIVDLFNKNDVDVIRFGAKCLETNKEFNRLPCDNGTILNQKDALKVLLTTYKLNCLWYQAYKAKCVKKCSKLHFSTIFAEDFLANINIYHNINSILIVTDTLYYYCVNSNSTTRNKEKNRIIGNIKGRFLASNMAIKFAKAEGLDYRGEVIYRQIKMARDIILDVDYIEKYDKELFKKDMKKNGCAINISEEDRGLLKGYMKEMPLKERIKNKKIILAIVDSDYERMWRYVRTFSKLNCIRRKR